MLLRKLQLQIEQYKIAKGEIKASYVKDGMIMKYGFNTEEDNRFKTISEFKECILRGGEPVFRWNGIVCGVCFSDIGYCIAHIDGSCEKICSTPDAVLEYRVGNDRLRDVITQVTVISRSV